MLQHATLPRRIVFVAIFFVAALAVSMLGPAAHAEGSSADLKSLSTGVGPISHKLDPSVTGFDPSITDYTAWVNGSIVSASISATATDPAATVQVKFLSAAAAPGSTASAVNPATKGSASGQVSLATGVNTITVVVTAADQSEKTYTISLTRRPDLKSLTVNGGTLNPGFFVLTFDYTISVPYSVSSVTLTPDANDDNVTQINIDEKLVSAKSPDTINLDVGEKTVTILTQNQDGSATCTYTIKITRYDASWQQVGGTICTNASTMLECTIGGFNYVAYNYFENNQSEIAIKRYDGSGWVAVGSKIAAYGAQYALYDCGGKPWLTYLDVKNANLMHVCSFTDASWSEAYQVDITHYRSNKGTYFVFGGNLYVAFSDPDKASKLSVLKYNTTSSAFAAVGNSGFSPGVADMISLVVDANTAYVAYRDTAFSNKASVMKLDGSTNKWVQVGDGTDGISSLQAQKILLAVDNGTPWLAYYETNQGYKANVVKFDGSKWAPVGTAQTTYTSFGYFAVDSGVPYLAFQDIGYKPTVIDFDGSSWQTVSYPCFTADQSCLEGISISAGMPFVVSSNLVYSCVPANSADLTGLVFSGSAGVVDETVDSSSSDVSFDIPGYLSNVRITPKPRDSLATISVSVNGNDQGAFANVSLNAGDNDFSVAVTSQDGSQTKTYTIHANRQPDNYLTGLDVQGYTLSPGYDKSVNAYALEVEGYQDTVSIMPTLSDSGNGGATVTVDGQPASSGGYSQVTLGAQSRTINIVVTASDSGKTTRTYSITVRKQSMTYQQVGGTITPASSDSGCVEMAVSNGVVYAGYLQGNTNPATIVVKRYNGKDWVQLGASFGGNIENEDSQWLQVSNGVPYVLYQNNSTEFYIKRFNGATWETVCKASGAGFPMNYVWGPVSFTVDDGIPYIAYAIKTADIGPQGNSIPRYFEGVYKYVGNAWVKLGSNSLGISNGPYVSDPIIKVFHGVPYVAYTINSAAYIVNLVHGSWAAMGSVDAAPTDFVMDSSTGACFLVYNSFAEEFANGLPGHAYTYLSGATSQGQFAASEGKAYVFCYDTNTYKGNMEVLGDEGCVYLSNPGALSVNSGALLASESGIPYLITEVPSGNIMGLSVNKFEPNNDATLCGICVNSAPVANTFDPSQKVYTAYVADNIISATVLPILSDRYASVQVNGYSVTYGNSCSVPLTGDSTAVTISTKSLDGSVTDSYMLTILRASASDSTLRALNLYGGASDLSVVPVFKPGTTSYQVTTPYSVSSVTLAASAENPSATVTGAGIKALQYGLNTFTVTVKSHDGKSTSNYKVAVARSYPAKPGVSLFATIPSLNYGFTPGGTNQLAINASLTTLVPATYKATVYNAKGKIMAFFTLSNQSSGAKTITWNGKATSGNTAGLKVGALVPVSSTGTAYTIKIMAQNPGGAVTTSGYVIKLYKNPTVSGFSVSPLKFQIDPLFGQRYVTVAFKVNHMTNAEVKFIVANGKVIFGECDVNLTNLVPNKTYYAKWNGYFGSNTPAARPGSPSKLRIQIVAGNTVYKPSTVVSVIWINP